MKYQIKQNVTVTSPYINHFPFGEGKFLIRKYSSTLAVVLKLQHLCVRRTADEKRKFVIT